MDRPYALIRHGIFPISPAGRIFLFVAQRALRVEVFAAPVRARSCPGLIRNQAQLVAPGLNEAAPSASLRNRPVDGPEEHAPLEDVRLLGPAVAGFIA